MSRSQDSFHISELQRDFGDSRRSRRNIRSQLESFCCIRCGYHVHTLPQISGVRNRNHCPYCLWSRHLDLYTAGDRLAACKESMRPIGLALKRTQKRYGDRSGELMLVHRCEGCGKLSLNRIAADDDATVIEKVFRSSFELDRNICNEPGRGEVHVLGPSDEPAVRRRLFGIV